MTAVPTPPTTESAAARKARPAHPPLLDQLAQWYPRLFGRHLLPLKRGIFEDLVAAHALDPAELKQALAWHARSTRYLAAVASGQPRHDLQGKAVEPVAPEHVHHALLQVFRRRQQRTQEDLSAELRQRIVRALEVYQATGKPFTWWHKNAMSPPLCTGPLLVLDAPLAWLEPRLARRLDMMLDAGAMDEARAALEHCDDDGSPGWSGIGCAEALAFLRGRLNFEECRSLWLRNTRAYAKRQLTWFRARKQALWLPPEDVDGVSQPRTTAGWGRS